MISETYNVDCLEYMKTVPDNFFDLAVVDPPYGGGFTETGGCQGWFSKYHQEVERTGNKELGVHFHGRGRQKKYQEIYSLPSEAVADKENVPAYNRFGNPGSRFEKYKRDPDGENGECKKKIIAWDTAPDKEYFDELFRISREQIIWGGNYFELPPTRCFLIWRKLTISENFTMAMAEYAWTSFQSNAKVFDFPPQDKSRFHPTQKPVELYQWIYRLYTKPGDKVFDSHMGSQSSRIAAYDAGVDYWGCEIDKTYYELGEERFEKYISQHSIFTQDYEEAEQDSLWDQS